MKKWVEVIFMYVKILHHELLCMNHYILVRIKRSCGPWPFTRKRISKVIHVENIYMQHVSWSIFQIICI